MSVKKELLSTIAQTLIVVGKDLDGLNVKDDYNNGVHFGELHLFEVLQLSSLLAVRLFL